MILIKRKTMFLSYVPVSLLTSDLAMSDTPYNEAIFQMS